MSITEANPAYTKKLPMWQKLIDCFEGQETIKDKGTTYLPATRGMIEGGLGITNSDGQVAYNNYKERAIYYNYVYKAVDKFLGRLHRKKAIIKLPQILEPMRDNATTNGESLQLLLRKINEHQLKTGRVGLLADIDTQDGQLLPYFAIYDAKSIVNWDDGAVEELGKQKLNLVVLDESEWERNSSFNWTWQKKHRVLQLGDLQENEYKGVYSSGMFRDDNFSPTEMVVPSIRGNTLNEIPFVFINAKDLLPEPDYPPLNDLANLSIKIYQKEADYNQNLFMQGQDTLVISGINNELGEEFRSGAGAVLLLPEGAKAEYVGVTSQGLAEQRQSLENDKKQADSNSGNAIDARSNVKESAEALNSRVGSEAASLSSIAIAGAAGLERGLKILAVWFGANPDEVEVIPNTDFTDDVITGKELTDLATAKRLGVPISNQTIHENMQRRDLTTRTYEEELELIQQEEDSSLGAGLESSSELM